MESFIAWRDAFEVEMAAAAGCVRDPRESKKTGKQLFEENADLARSDMGVPDADVFEAELSDLVMSWRCFWRGVRRSRECCV